jgi:hypothetical protein
VLPPIGDAALPTLGRVSDADRDAGSLSDALDRILNKFPADAPEADRPATAPVEIPEIVPATPDVEAVAAALPTLPARPVSSPTPPSDPEPTQAPAVAAPAVITAPVIAAPASPAPATAWGDYLPAGTTQAAGPALRAPGRRPRVRRVTRVVRHVDPWSTFKLALVFSLVGYLVVLTSGVLLWRVAGSTGTLDNVERWFTQFGWETFELKGGEIFRNAVVIGLFAAVGLTGAAVLAATLFNLVSDIVGGIRVTVLEEEVVERTASSARRYVVRRPPIAGTFAPSPAWSVDDPPPAVAASLVASDWSVDDPPTGTRDLG